jgi:type II secretory ATPase GspE/PulE/Tfp pilus assembly ATPase PilB-like protein
MQATTVVMAAIEAGGYINLLKLLPVLIVLVIWARLLTWMDKDAVVAHLPREWLNAAMFLSGLGGVLLFLMLPGYGLALGALLLLILVPIGVYFGIRHQKVGLADLKTEFSGFMSGMGRKSREKEAKAGEVQISTKSGVPLDVPEAEDLSRAGYDAAMSLLTDPLRLNAERIELRPGEGGARMQFYVDGFPYDGPAMDAASAAAGINYIKMAAKMDTEDRRKPQSGQIRAALDGKKHEIDVTTAGSTAGESMRLMIDAKKRHGFKLDSMGFSPDQLEMMKASIEENRGIVLVTAPKGQGLTSMLYTILRGHDAFVNHLQTVERVPREDIEGITQNKIAPGGGPQEEHKQVEWVASQLPDTLMLDEITSPESARSLMQFVSDGKRAYVGMRAGSVFDAIMAWRKLVGDDMVAAKDLVMVINGRVMRRLCMACKVAYEPDPEMLRKLNMDPNRVDKLYQARTEPMRDNRGKPIPCEFCHDLHYKGRFGVFETLVIDDDMRKAIMSGGSVNQLKTIFRKQRGLYLQEMALLQVEAGETSVQEVLRVLKSDQSSPSSAAARAPSAPAASPPAAGARRQR